MTAPLRATQRISTGRYFKRHKGRRVAVVHAAINRAIDLADDCACVTRNGRRVIGSKDNERLAKPRCAGRRWRYTASFGNKTLTHCRNTEESRYTHSVPRLCSYAGSNRDGSGLPGETGCSLKFITRRCSTLCNAFIRGVCWNFKWNSKNGKHRGTCGRTRGWRKMRCSCSIFEANDFTLGLQLHALLPVFSSNPTEFIFSLPFSLLPSSSSSFSFFFFSFTSYGFSFARRCYLLCSRAICLLYEASTVSRFSDSIRKCRNAPDLPLKIR